MKVYDRAIAIIVDFEAKFSNSINWFDLVMIEIVEEINNGIDLDLIVFIS